MAFGSRIFARMERINSNAGFFAIFKIVFVLIIVLYFFVVISNRLDPDFGWHIRVGDWIRQYRELPRIDTLSYTMNGYLWVDHEWAINAVLSFAYGKNLGLLVSIIFSILAAVPFAGWVLKAKSYAPFFPILAGVFAVSGFISVRPAVISFVMFFLLFEILNKRYGEGCLKKDLYFFAGVLVLIWFWANLHAGFIAGIALLCLFVFFEQGQKFFSGGKPEFKELAFDISLIFGCVLVSLINPYGIDLFEEIARIMLSPETHGYISEWRSGFFSMDWQVSLFCVPFVFFVFMFGRKQKIANLLVASVFFALFLKSARQFIPFLVTAMPVMNSGAEMVRQDLLASKAVTPAIRKCRGLLAWFFIISTAAVIYVNFCGVLTDNGLKYYPRDAVRVLNEYAKGRDVVLFNEYGWGGYLAMEAPEIKVFIDGRMPHWVDADGNSAMKDYVKVFYSDDRAAIDKIIDKWHINTVLIGTGSAAATAGNEGKSKLAEMIISALPESWTEKKKYNEVRKILVEEGWRVEFEDSVSVLLVK